MGDQQDGFVRASGQEFKSSLRAGEKKLIGMVPKSFAGSSAGPTRTAHGPFGSTR
jgi:hypothetical protein